ncbi:hypothetical protein LCGC14_3143300 [marine sediment metagenome]|uniref:Uncharacterized protein n=1 Tax=marine sediment metagenome TaxID=412755 RepID=A0A0F8VW61_9ZZZZ
MTVQELIDKLKEFNPELPVFIEFEDTLFKPVELRKADRFGYDETIALILTTP